MHHLWAQLLELTGTRTSSSMAYNLWSGFGGDLAFLAAVIAYPWVAYRRHNCQVKGCWRIGRHEFADPDGVKRALCHVHHPAVKRRQITREQLHLYIGKHPGKG